MSEKKLYTVSFKVERLDSPGEEDLMYSTIDHPLTACYTFVDHIINNNHLNKDAYEPSDHYALTIRPCEYTADIGPFENENRFGFDRFQSNQLSSKKRFLRYFYREFEELDSKNIIKTLSQHIQDIEAQHEEKKRDYKMKKINDLDRQIAYLLAQKKELELGTARFFTFFQ